jgi:hypothetical protein
MAPFSGFFYFPLPSHEIPSTLHKNKMFAALNYGASTPPGEQTELKFACSVGPL